MVSICCFLRCTGAEAAGHSPSGPLGEDDALLLHPGERVTPAPDFFCTSFAFIFPHIGGCKSHLGRIVNAEQRMVGWREASVWDVTWSSH